MRNLTLVVVLAFSVPLGAQQNRSAVSTTGLDTNLCTITSPCRSFVRAMEMTNERGEIVALASGGYGPFSIDKAVTVVASPGVHAGITAMNTDGITIAVVSIEDFPVVLRGLNINFIGVGSFFGINHSTLNSMVHVENCTISGRFGGGGIHSTRLTVKDSVIRDVSAPGILISQGTATIDRTRLENNLRGVEVQRGQVLVSRSVVDSNSIGFKVQSSGLARLVISDSVVVRNFTGVEASISTGGTVLVVVTNSLLSRNQTGFSVLAGATGLLSNTPTFLNSVGVSAGGTVFSTGNNAFANNSTDVSGALTPAALQ